MPEPWNDVTSATVSAISRLQHGYLTTPRDPWAVRTLASLRRADESRPGADPSLWDVTLGRLPDELLGHGTSPATAAERAVHAAVVLYAVHQQSRAEPMHATGVGLGQAVRMLSVKRSDGTEWDPGTISRFQHMCRAQQWAIRVDNLRGLVTLMRSEAVPLDYGRLAADLWRLQVSAPDQVLLKWGRQLHRIPLTKQAASTETDQGEPR
ncbi:type I-E CRISPR-associated protein Cse2/CasB [Cutibacterium sp. WCA-380-WT-3A]|uniref:Type I-E CRISPR-associated protein Cse2/CasB n=1 Tax=Cutibacterium porci TaxID=2605781 RepID=A0A7K0J9G5_9ACTN|nr:type I-E CRISPR-associated protein Cse2/CasB [Cutibacterium porci]MSS46398.1 type I-E CRISPR-associated protein Cse2/CasB [Cutibacterium porci]